MATLIIEDKLAAWVADLPEVISIAGGRVYPFGDIPQDTDWPFVTYFQTSGERMWHLRGTSGVSHPSFQIGCHAHSYRETKLLANAIRLAMDEFGRGDLGGLTVQTMRTGTARDYGGNDGDLDPIHGDGVSQPCTSFDVTIWFQEG
ncbi:MAG TPA: DUF3168 domain-containing protein [Gemmata sp.]